MKMASLIYRKIFFKIKLIRKKKLNRWKWSKISARTKRKGKGRKWGSTRKKLLMLLNQNKNWFSLKRRRRTHTPICKMFRKRLSKKQLLKGNTKRIRLMIYSISATLWFIWKLFFNRIFLFKNTWIWKHQF
jgi:hypothetical protein